MINPVCPFCGRGGRALRINQASDGKVCVMCNMCLSSGPICDTPKQARAAWLVRFPIRPELSVPEVQFDVLFEIDGYEHKSRVSSVNAFRAAQEGIYKLKNNITPEKVSKSMSFYMEIRKTEQKERVCESSSFLRKNT